MGFELVGLDDVKAEMSCSVSHETPSQGLLSVTMIYFLRKIFFLSPAEISFETVRLVFVVVTLELEWEIEHHQEARKNVCAFLMNMIHARECKGISWSKRKSKQFFIIFSLRHSWRTRKANFANRPREWIDLKCDTEHIYSQQEHLDVYVECA